MPSPASQRRLEHAIAPLIATAVEPASIPSAASAPPPVDRRFLLDDRQMRKFIASGFLLLGLPEFERSFHERIYAAALEEYGPRNNGLRGTGGTVERIPALKDVIQGPTLRGALQSLLGPCYISGHLGNHGCAMHVSTDEDQIFHKDTQRGVITGHRTRACMVMYYPGGAEESMGPTALVPSSHLLSRDGLGTSMGVTHEEVAAAADREDWSGVQRLAAIAGSLAEHKVVVPLSAAGSVCIVHEDMIHRATPRLAGDRARWRPMFKWSFTRLLAPDARQGPSWNHDTARWSVLGTRAQSNPWPHLSAPDAAPICESLWSWHLGGKKWTGASAALSRSQVDTLGRVLLAPPRDGDEAYRVGTAYQLGAAVLGRRREDSQLALHWLRLAASSTDNESARRVGALGLGSAGDAAVEVLLDILQLAEAPLVVASALEALGEAAQAPHLAVVQQICVVQATQATLIEQECRAKKMLGVGTSTENDCVTHPEFEAGGMTSHVNDQLQVPIMMPTSCRRTAVRYLAIALGNAALGKIAQRCALPTCSDAGTLSTIRHSIAVGLRPWLSSTCPRVRQECGRALLCLASATARSGAIADGTYASECQALQTVVQEACCVPGRGAALAKHALHLLITDSA